MNTLKEFCQSTIDELSLLNAPHWAEKWVDKRMELSRKFFNGKSTSTTHGIDIFRKDVRKYPRCFPFEIKQLITTSHGD